MAVIRAVRCFSLTNGWGRSWIRFGASRIVIWATNFGGNSGIMSNPMKIREKVVGAKGFEPSTSWSRTRRASQAALRPDDLQRGKQLCCKGFLEYHSLPTSATGLFSHCSRPNFGRGAGPIVRGKVSSELAKYCFPTFLEASPSSVAFWGSVP